MDESTGGESRGGRTLRLGRAVISGDTSDLSGVIGNRELLSLHADDLEVNERLWPPGRGQSCHLILSTDDARARDLLRSLGEALGPPHSSCAYVLGADTWARLLRAAEPAAGACLQRPIPSGQREVNVLANYVTSTFYQLVGDPESN